MAVEIRSSKPENPYASIMKQRIFGDPKEIEREGGLKFSFEGEGRIVLSGPEGQIAVKVHQLHEDKRPGVIKKFLGSEVTLVCMVPDTNGNEHPFLTTFRSTNTFEQNLENLYRYATLWRVTASLPGAAQTTLI